MNRPRIRRTTATLVVLLVALGSACGTNSDRQDMVDTDAATDGASESPTPRAGDRDDGCREIVPADLEGIDELRRMLPLPEEAQEGITQCLRRPSNVDTLFHTDYLAARLTETGLRDHFVTGLSHWLNFPEGGDLAGGMNAAVIVFDAEEPARDAVDQLQSALPASAELVEDPLVPAERIPAPGLGDASFGFRGTWSEAIPDVDAVIYVWQRRDRVLMVRGWGPIGETGSAPKKAMLRVARTMDERAS